MTVTEMTKASLPILDMSDYLTSPDSDGGRRFVSMLRETSHGIGFFILSVMALPLIQIAK